MNFTESILMAFRSIGANRLRSFLTLLSIAIGVMAIIGVAAAVDALQSKLDAQLESFGRNSFILQRDPPFERRGDERPNITLRTAQEFKRRMGPYAKEIGLSYETMGAVVKRGGEETDPDIQIVGGDESFSSFSDYTVAEGRMVDPADVQNAADVVVLGADIAKKLYPTGESPVNTTVAINGQRYRVIGVFAAKGAVFGQSQDKFVALPVTNAARHFVDEWSSTVQVMVRSGERGLEETRSQAIGIMRVLRRLDLGEENDFDVITNDSINETFGSFTGYIALFGLACGIIALVAAGVGIMNIMLVSVKERTREIGIRKAIGASRRTILLQFLIEAVTLCQLGAWIGIGLGVMMGLGLAGALEATLPIPWGRIAVSVAVCTLIGIIFGIYPAWRAARLDPIDALRYE